MRRLALALCLIWASCPTARADDVAGMRLLNEGRAAEAAELFDDPAWKGVALFRSDQLPRAASAFARAGDAASLHNLGNVYVILGYPNLAVEAYQRSLALDPSARETRENLDMVLAAIRDKRGKGGGEDPPGARELARLQPRPGQEQEEGPQKEPEQGSASDQQAAKPPDRPEAGSGGDQKPGQSGANGGGRSRDQNAPPGEAPGQAKQGSEGVPDAPADSTAAAGRAAGDAREGAPPRSAAQALAESQRATEAWLAGIADRSPALAAKRIAAESARRRARSGPLPEPADPW
jgi:Ca-activated chloride channel family protein